VEKNKREQHRKKASKKQKPRFLIFIFVTFQIAE